MADTETLKLTAGDATVEVAPWRGGLVTRFDVAGRPVLYLDESSLHDPSKNVRGGVPVLFPTPGKLADDRWSWHGQSGALPQHGFARSLAWEVVAHSANEAVLRLTWDGAPPDRWHWPCTIEMRYTLKGHTLRLAPTVTNHGTSPMPFGFGLHPYFLVESADKATLRIPTHATRAFDNVSKREIALTNAIDLTAREVDLHLVDHGSAQASLLWARGRRVDLRCSAELTRWVIWTLAEKPFVCLEPWNAPGNAMNGDARLIVVEPGALHASFVEMSVTV